MENGWDYLYYAIVTVTTVGYGDMGPNRGGYKGVSHAGVATDKAPTSLLVFTMFYVLVGVAVVGVKVFSFAGFFFGPMIEWLAAAILFTKRPDKVQGTRYKSTRCWVRHSMGGV
jgi:hypothetical protein